MMMISSKQIKMISENPILIKQILIYRTLSKDKST